MEKLSLRSHSLLGLLVAVVVGSGCSGSVEDSGEDGDVGGSRPTAGSTAVPTGGSAPGQTNGGSAATGAGGTPNGSGGAPNAAGGTPSGSGGAPNAAGGTPPVGGAQGGTGTVTPSGGTSSQGGSGGPDQGGSAGAPAQGGVGNAPSVADGTGAPESGPSGYGKGTTGGGNGKVTTASSLGALQSAVDAYSGSGGLVLKYTGKFDFAKISDPCVQHTLEGQQLEIKNKSNITVQGDDGSSANFGIHISGSSSNVIVRNMTIGLTPGGDSSDIISVEGVSKGTPTNIWIDHNEFFTSMATCPGAGDTAFDGMIDVKKGADKITVSYNYLHDHHKVSLNGFTDTDDQVRHITFHHNIFENIGSRTPLQRHGYAHVVNNYFKKVTTSGINVRMGGFALVEANYFETVVNPVTARDSDEIGFWDLRNNNLATAADVSPGNRFGITWSKGDTGTVNATTWTTSKAFPEALGYDYKAQPFQCIHDGLRAAAGAGKGLVTLKCK